MAMLTWERKDGQRMVFHLQGLEATVGRDAGNLIRLDSGFVSKRHAVIRLGPQGYTITDLNSSNGTFVNSRRISLALAKDGDRIEFGSEVLVFSNAPAGAHAGPLQAGAGSRRNSRLLVVAGAGALVIVVLLVLVVIGSRAGNVPSAASGAAPAVSQQAAPDENTPPAAVPLETFFGAPAAADRSAGAADPALDSQPLPSNDPLALYEMALAHVSGNRLVEARRLLRASVRIDPGNASAQQRLRQVDATIQLQADSHLAAAQRAFTYLRFDDAIIEFEQVMQMVPQTDPRYQQAAGGLRRAHERLGR